MKFAYLVDEDGVRMRHILDALAVHRFRGEADEIDRVSEPEGVADLADGLEAADTGSLAGARIDDDDRPLARVELDAGRGKDTDQRVVDRSGQRGAVQHKLEIVNQDRLDAMRAHLRVLIAAPAQNVHEQDRPLREVAPILDESHRRQPAQFIERGRRQLADLFR